LEFIVATISFIHMFRVCNFRDLRLLAIYTVENKRECTIRMRKENVKLEKKDF